MAHLVVAHPGHELLLHGWIDRSKPVVHVLTDGSAHGVTSRIGPTMQLLHDLGARPGAIFGRLTDVEAYTMLLECNAELLLTLALELAGQPERERPELIVVDAVEGYNPVHNLCRLIAGAAIGIAGIESKLYEYAVVDDPRSARAALVVELDDAEYAEKITRARNEAATLADIDALLARHGPEGYRRETLCRVDDSTAACGEAVPRYEHHGEARVAAGRYAHVIRGTEHMLPLRDALLAALEKRTCAF